MAASVHHTINAAAVVDLFFIANAQSVNVGPYAELWRFVSEIDEYSPFLGAKFGFQTEFRQPFHQIQGGLKFFPARFRLKV